MILQIISIILEIIGSWILILFFLPLIVLPNHLFKTKIQENKNLKDFAKRFKAPNKEKTLKNVYNFIIGNYVGRKEEYRLAFIPLLFYTNVEEILKKKGFLACTVQNLVLVTLLINTGQFKEKDLRRVETLSYFWVIHQVVLVKIDKKVFKVDPFIKLFKEEKCQTL